MSEFLKKNQLAVGLIALFFVTLYFAYYYTLLVILTLIVLHFFYSMFYTKPPKIREVFMVVGLALGAVNTVHPLSLAISVFIIVSTFECMRVVVMAILNYPSTIQDLKDLTEDLEKRVEERTAELKEANRQLQIANERLQELDKMKSAFVSQASHDLRTPLTAIKGSLENLSLGIAGEMNEKQKKILDRATRSVDRLTHLINDVLDLSRIESGRVVLEKANVSMKSIVEQAIQENRPAAELRRISLDAETTADLFTLNADGGKMARVVGELIGNAIKYTPEGGTVTVALAREGETPVEPKNLVLSVRDSGIGMTPEDCKRIWERFYRSSASKYFAKGSGLGLSIAKELVELHGGTISVESEEGKGTTFFLHLPVG